MNSDEQSHKTTTDRSQPETLTFRDVATFFRRYTTFLTLTTATFLVACIVVALIAWLTAPSKQVTTLPFQLEFEGAELGQYPNGTKFSPEELLGTSSLFEVYKANQLDQVLGFNEFRGSVYVIEDNEALDRLMRQYEARLADPRLSPVDRERIEAEFSQKRAALSRSGYSIRLQTDASLRAIDPATRSKVLTDILSKWADQAVRKKGVLLYDVSILSSDIFEDEGLESFDYLVALDILRSRINRVLRNIEELQSLPGAKVVKTESKNTALADLHVRLSDTKEFRLQPLLTLVAANGLTKDPGSTLAYLRTRLTFNELAEKEAEARIDVIRDALDAYVLSQERSQARRGARSDAMSSGETVIPQVDEGFLDRIVSLSTGPVDTAYRQQLVNSMKERSLEAVPIRSEVDYYTTMTTSLKRLVGDARPLSATDSANVKAEMQVVLEESRAVADQVEEIYLLLSKNLNPSTALYSTGGLSTTTQRALSISRLFTYVFLALLLFVPTLIFATFLRDRLVRAE